MLPPSHLPGQAVCLQLRWLVGHDFVVAVVLLVVGECSMVLLFVLLLVLRFITAGELFQFLVERISLKRLSLISTLDNRIVKFGKRGQRVCWTSPTLNRVEELVLLGICALEDLTQIKSNLHVCVDDLDLYLRWGELVTHHQDPLNAFA